MDAKQRARVSVGMSAAGGGMTVCVYVCVCDGGRRAHPVYGRADTLLAQSAREDVHIFAQRKGGRGGGVRATKTQFASIEFFFGFRPIATFVCISLGWGVRNGAEDAIVALACKPTPAGLVRARKPQDRFGAAPPHSPTC